MTWREFQLKKAGWEREQLRKWEHTRLIAYFSGAGQSIDPKKSMQSWMPLNELDNKSEIPEEQKQAFKEAMKQYQQQVKEKDGKG